MRNIKGTLFFLAKKAPEVFVTSITYLLLFLPLVIFFILQAIAKKFRGFFTTGVLSYSKILNLLYVAIFLGAVVGVYLIFLEIPTIKNFTIKQLGDELPTKNNAASTLMTADGLITTSTFAFAALTSISPSSSGSTLVINRIGWRRVWVFSYPFLLVLTTLITLADVLFIEHDMEVAMFAGVLLSSAILIVIIIAYVSYHLNVNKKAAKKIIILINYLTKKQNVKNLKKYTRRYFNPLKGSQNVDLFREILTSSTVLKLISEIIEADKSYATKLTNMLKNMIAMNVKNPELKIEIDSVANDMDSNYTLIQWKRALYSKIIFMIYDNKVLSNDQKIEIAVKMSIKKLVESRKNHAAFTKADAISFQNSLLKNFIDESDLQDGQIFSDALKRFNIRNMEQSNLDSLHSIHAKGIFSKAKRMKKITKSPIQVGKK